MGSIVAEIADKIASAGGGERSELEVRGGVGADGGGILTLSTSELTVVDGDKLGRIDFQAPLESSGTDAILVGASIYAEADATFSASDNSTELVFAVGESEAAVERVRIDRGGKVGIGVATPASLLHVAGTVQVGVDDTGHDVRFYAAAAGASMYWNEAGAQLEIIGATADHATDSAGTLVLATNQTAVVDGDRLGQIDFQAPAEANASDSRLIAASIWAEADDTFAADNNSAELVFATGASELAAEKMRLTHDGELGIGEASPEGTLHIKTGDSGLAPSSAADDLFIENNGDHAGLTIGTNNNAYDGRIYFANQDATTDGRIVYDNGERALHLWSGGTKHLVLSSAGELTTPVQPSFSVKASTQNNMAEDTNVTLTFGTEDYDIGSNWASNTFTAPVTGYYLHCITCNLKELDDAATAHGVHLKASNRTYECWWGTGHWDADGKFTACISHVVEMDASDTVYWYYYGNLGAAQGDMHPDSRWTGMLLG